MKHERLSRVAGRVGSNILIVTALCLSFSTTHAQSQAGGFVVDPKSGCKVWNPHPQSNETVSWSGGCIDGMAQGVGTLQWLNNNKPYEKDEGEWIRGQQSGRGTQVWASGRYDGDLLNGEPQGRGAMTLQSERYEGDFRNGKPNGIGTLTSLEGLFQGNWRDGCLVGDKRRIAFGVSSSTCR